MHPKNPPARRVFPNFFLIGAPKSGTTALSEYLRAHPDILFSTPKEPHYFNDDFSCRYIATLKDYLRCFSAHTDEAAIGEGSVFYLRSRTAVPNIISHRPDAKFIVMLRNPVEAAYAWHWQAISSFGETETDFETAWNLQTRRAEGKMLPRRNLVREALQYGTLFKYGEQLERLYASVPRPQIKIIFYDDFRRDPRNGYFESLEFLGLERLDVSSYATVNPSQALRSIRVEDALEFTAKVSRNLGMASGLQIVSRLRKLNTKQASRPPLPCVFKNELIEYFKDDIEKTSRLTGRNLDTWLHA